MIRDTSAQDRVLTPPPGHSGKRRIWLIAAIAGAVLASAGLVWAWGGSERSVDVSRLRIADVHESYGGGLRFAFREGAVARLQIAQGSEGLRAAVTLNGDF